LTTKQQQVKPGLTASIIIPSYNRPAAVCRCLDALALQKVPQQSFEVIVVDDGSHPALAVDQDRWKSAFDLRVIRQQNTGPAGARQHGALVARSVVLAFTDDDCVPQPTWLLEMLAALQLHPRALIGGSTSNALPDNPGAETSQLIMELVYDHFNAGEQAYFFASNNIACHRQDYLDSGGFDLDFPAAAAEDREFCDRWRMQGRPLRYVPAARIEHRHPQSFLQFVGLHFRYGQGAYVYQAKRRVRKSGTMREDFGFHRSLVAAIRGKLSGHQPGYQIGIAIRLAAWQVANTAGFFYEAIRWAGQFPSRRPRQVTH
jgi:GT2 family glycosyltransferase